MRILTCSDHGRVATFGPSKAPESVAALVDHDAACKGCSVSLYDLQTRVTRFMSLGEVAYLIEPTECIFLASLRLATFFGEGRRLGFLRVQQATLACKGRAWMKYDQDRELAHLQGRLGPVDEWQTDTFVAGYRRAIEAPMVPFTFGLEVFKQSGA